MPELEVLKLVAQTTPALLAAGLVFWVMFKAFEKLTGQLAELIRNNTEALTRLGGSTDQTCEALAKHDQRVEQIQGVVNRIDGTTQRIEAGIEKLQGSRAPAGR